MEKSVKQTLTASSTMKAKYVACYETMYQAIQLQNFISGLGILDTIVGLLKIFCDYFVEISFFGNTRISFYSKHIKINIWLLERKQSSLGYMLSTLPHNICFSSKSVLGACDSYEFIAVFCCIDLVGVLCVCAVNTIYIVMYINISLCKHFVEYDMINVLIRDIQNKSQWASC